ncbi:cytochrome P450 [Ochromonadaceae sp. CCMP2298]|nr:cytochrome P450 [Ochromonadaceae sp. CCMP2298]|mmetsp:Transcript_21393/g.47505  ORF Transcript_21393/g.47505 Transcript_21393/m.47505 type:complete len:497 (-) Transcript_21393:81-1571(-)|eukprot:CAMPEP_0173246946 /NCGR_PEP_ID=MMETSP1142-20121109/17614_1 /TAXON_ID=483371 /ORGANISM="non described non described, Strain CCMP2298" /LENGTH=496 /DNA_ID=CAMNT_0014179255 /DNA_START=69 /DNA_END=1559 /DNA_ORIENTATION=+
MDSWDSSTLLIAAPFAAILLLVVYKSSQKRNTSIPAVQGGLPFFGQMFIMLKGSPWDTMGNWVKDYGTIFRVHLFGSDAVVVADPALLKIILATKLSVFEKDLAWTYKPFMVLLGNGLVTSSGASWRHQRTLLANHLKINILEEIPGMALKAVKRLCVKLDKAKADGTEVEMAAEFRHLTLQVIAETILSLSPEESDQTFAHMYLPIVEEGNLRTWNPERMYIPTPSWFKFRRDVAKLNNYVEGLVTKRWALRQQEAAGGSSRRQDILDKAMSAISPEEWGRAAIVQIRDEVKTFVLAGHETSASMLAWSLYELSRQDSGKESLQKLQEEANIIYSGCKDASGRICSVPERSVLDKLVFSECCLRESLRKYSPVPTVVRVSNQDVQLNEYSVCKGSTLMLCMQGVHLNPDIWPEPLAYKPERFLGEIAPYTFIPFIEGPRMCLGQYLSLLESKVVLSTLLSTYRFEVTNPDDAGLKHPFMVPIIPKIGHFMKIHDI